MRNFKLLVLGLLITAGAYAADPTKPMTVESKLQNQIDNHLGQHELDIYSDVTARLTFMVTAHNEIVVLRVVSKDASAETFIKTKLNYKEVEDVAEAKDKTYTMKVKLKPAK